MNNFRWETEKYFQYKKQKAISDAYSKYYDRKRLPISEIGVVPSEIEDIEEFYKTYVPKQPIKGGDLEIMVVSATGLKKNLTGCHLKLKLKLRSTQYGKEKVFPKQFYETKVAENTQSPILNSLYKFKISDFYREYVYVKLYNHTNFIGYVTIPVNHLPMGIPIQMALRVQGMDVKDGLLTDSMFSDPKSVGFPGEVFVVVKAVNFGIDHYNFLRGLETNITHNMKSQNSTVERILKEKINKKKRAQRVRNGFLKDLFGAIFNISGRGNDLL